jgi:hypothetical protein
MSQDRYRELIEKRDGPGLSDEESDELGRLEAEQEAQPYGGAEARAAAEELEDRADDEGRRARAESAFEVREEERTEDLEER